MFDNRIEMGLLAEAYRLSVPGCIELAQHVRCEFGTLSINNNEPYDLKESDNCVTQYARKLLESVCRTMDTV